MGFGVGRDKCVAFAVGRAIDNRGMGAIAFYLEPGFLNGGAWGSIDFIFPADNVGGGKPSRKLSDDFRGGFEVDP